MPKPIKPIKAWAEVMPDGTINESLGGLVILSDKVVKRARLVTLYKGNLSGSELFPVLITPLSRTKKKKK